MLLVLERMVYVNGETIIRNIYKDLIGRELLVLYFKRKLTRRKLITLFCVCVCVYRSHCS